MNSLTSLPFAAMSVDQDPASHVNTDRSSVSRGLEFSDQMENELKEISHLANADLSGGGMVTGAAMGVDDGKTSALSESIDAEPPAPRFSSLPTDDNSDWLVRWA